MTGEPATLRVGVQLPEVERRVRLRVGHEGADVGSDQVVLGARARLDGGLVDEGDDPVLVGGEHHEPEGVQQAQKDLTGGKTTGKLIIKVA